MELSGEVNQQQAYELAGLTNVNYKSMWTVRIIVADQAAEE